MNEDIENGLLSELDSDNIFESDYLGSTEKEYPSPKVASWDNLIEVNQGADKETTSGCTVAGTLGAVCTNLGLGEKFYADLFKLLWKLACAKGAKQPGGRYLGSAVDHVREYVNTHKKDFGLQEHEVLKSERTTWYSELPRELMQKGYCIAGGYKGNSKYNADRLDNGIIDGSNFDVTYGHLLMYVNPKSGVFSEKNPVSRDSYKGRKYNQYGYSQFMTLVKNNNVYSSCYFFYVESTKSAYDLEYEEAIKLGITNGKDPDAVATRKQTAVMTMRAVKLLSELVRKSGN